MSLTGAKEYLAKLDNLSPLVSEQTKVGRHLFEKYVPDVVRARALLNGEIMKPGALETKYKELIAAAIASITGANCCIDFHVRNAIMEGASAQQVAEAVAVAIATASGPIYSNFGPRVIELAEEFEKEHRGK